MDTKPIDATLIYQSIIAKLAEHAANTKKGRELLDMLGAFNQKDGTAYLIGATFPAYKSELEELINGHA